MIIFLKCICKGPGETGLQSLLGKATCCNCRLQNYISEVRGKATSRCDKCKMTQARVDSGHVVLFKPRTQPWMHGNVRIYCLIEFNKMLLMQSSVTMSVIQDFLSEGYNSFSMNLLWLLSLNMQLALQQSMKFSTSRPENDGKTSCVWLQLWPNTGVLVFVMI